MKRWNIVNFVLIALLVLAFCSNCSMQKRDDKNNKSITAKEFIGITLIARSDYNNLDKFMSFGSLSVPQNATCELFANEVYTSRYGTSLKKGDSFEIGNAIILENTDGFGNSGTKLILESTNPKKGLTLYCYAFDPDKKQFWALDKDTVLKILNELFVVE